MANENDRPKETGNTTIRTRSVSKTDPEDPVPSSPATEADLEQVRLQLSGFERSALRWTRASFIVVLATGVFIALQWHEMHTGGQDTHDLALAAKTQADKMKDMSEAANKIRQAAEGMVAQEQRIADNAQKSLDASSRQSKAALDASIASARNDQRAWVSSDNPAVDGLEVGKSPAGHISWRNTGKTFAKHVYPTVTLTFSSTIIASEAELIELSKTGETQPGLSIGTLAPQAVGSSDVTKSFTLTAAQLDEFKNWYTYLYGDVKYVDIFGMQHNTRFCGSRKGLTGPFVQCPFYNDAD